MNRLTITAKGQITLRKDLLSHLGAQPGEKLVVEQLPDNAIMVRAEKRAGKISDVFGALHRPGRKALSIDEINSEIANAWALRK